MASSRLRSPDARLPGTSLHERPAVSPDQVILWTAPAAGTYQFNTDGSATIPTSASTRIVPDLTERLEERTCGVWAVDLNTGQTRAFLRFESGVQEIFSVQVLRRARFPDIIEWADPRVHTSFVVPDDALKDVKMPGPPPDAR